MPAGRPDSRRRTHASVVEIKELTVTDQVIALARELVAKVPMPAKAEVDAYHIAVAAVHGMDYLLTWNCSHIANAELRHRIEEVCRSNGVEPPVICTPQELLAK